MSTPSPEVVEAIYRFKVSDILSAIAILIAFVSLILTLVFNRREKPNFMPSGQSLTLQHFELFWQNTSLINVQNLTIMINGFDKNLNEIKELSLSDKYLFVIGGNSKISYGFNLGKYAQDGFFFRVRFKGKYSTKFYWKKKFEQSIWYSVTRNAETAEGAVQYLIHSTHKDEIDRIQDKFLPVLRNHEIAIDKKFS